MALTLMTLKALVALMTLEALMTLMALMTLVALMDLRMTIKAPVSLMSPLLCLSYQWCTEITYDVFGDVFRAVYAVHLPNSAIATKSAPTAIPYISD